MRRVLDLFAGGAGGWSLGLHWAGFETVAACEIDPWRRAEFGRKFPEAKLYDDVRTLTGTRLAADGVVPDIIVGSPPCQDISAANYRGQGTGGARSGLFSEFIRLVREVRPRWAIAENSPRLRTRGADWVLASLAAAGYATWPLVVGAWHAGANHRRDRVWIVAADTDIIGRRGMGACEWDRNEFAGSVIVNADFEGLAFRKSERGDACKELAAAERNLSEDAYDAAGERCEERISEPRISWQWRAQPQRSSSGPIGQIAEPPSEPLGHFGFTRPRSASWLGWNGGAPDFDVLDDGLPAGLDLAAAQRAYGDAIVPQLAEALGRAIIAIEGEI